MQFLIGAVVIFAIFSWIAKQTGQILAWIEWRWVIGAFIFLCTIFALSVFIQNKRREREQQALEKLAEEKEKARRSYLLSKYLGDIETVEKIMSRSVWEGQTEGELIDSLGEPIEVDQKILKTKSKEIWKYKKIGKGRFGLRVILENDSVVGWEMKDSA